MQRVPTRYFDGKSSRANNGQLTLLANGNLALFSSDSMIELPLKGLMLGQHIPGTPYQIILPEGGTLELAPSKESDQFVRAAFPLASRIPEHLERNSKRSLSTMVISLCALCAFIYYGIPALSAHIYPIVPEAVKERAGNNTISLLDLLLFKDSALNETKQNQLRALAEPLLHDAFPDKSISIQFRGTRTTMANAMAIFPHTVICTDELVNLLSPEEVQAVLAHEVGHLKLDHGTRQLINQMALTIIPALTMGTGLNDSYFLKFVIHEILPSSFSREQEREADAFAVTLLKRLSLHPEYLASALEKLDANAHAQNPQKDEMVEKIGQIFSSHPDLKERREAILGR